MNEFEQRMQTVRELFETLDPDKRDIVSFYVEQLREQLGKYGVMDTLTHVVYLGIALDFVAAEYFLEASKQ